MNRIQGLLSRLTPGARSVAHMMSGAALAQLVSLLITPIITRLYDPTEYGAMALFLSIVFVLLPIVNGRFDLAVLLPSESQRGDRDANALVDLAILLAVASCTALLALVSLSLLLGWSPWQTELGPWLLLIPATTFASSLSMTLRSFAIRQRRYARVAHIPVLQRLGTGGIQLAAGVMHWGKSGLILGAVAGPLIGLPSLFRIRRSARPQHPIPLTWRERLATMRTLAMKYRDFPKLNMPFSVLNALSLNLQNLLLSLFLPFAAVGEYAMAVTLLGLPSTLVASQVGQVYAREAAAQISDSLQARRLAARAVRGLTTVGVPAFAVVALAAPTVLPVLLGEDWSTVGFLVQALSPLFLARFVTASAAAALEVYQRSGRLLVWQCSYLIATFAIYGLGWYWGWSIVTIAWGVSLVGSPIYLALIPMAFSSIRRRNELEQSATRGETDQSGPPNR